MGVPEKKKDLMSLNGRLAAMIRYMSKATEECIPFFNQVKKGGTSCGLRSVRSHFRI